MALPPEARHPPNRSKWGDLALRALSAAVLAPLAVAGVWLGGWLWVALIGVAALVLAGEWAGFARLAPTGWPGALLPSGLLLAIALCVAGQAAAALLALAVVTLIGRLAGPRALAAGLPYLGVAIVSLLWLRGDGATGREDVLFLLGVVWSSDVGAYLAGRLIGGPRLAPAISPGKTWAGALGALAATALVGLVAAHGQAVGWAMLVGALLGIATQVGDLLESALKRRFGVKDSGRLIPGHGGLLDRVDGLLLAAPLAALIALAVGPGVPLWR